METQNFNSFQDPMDVQNVSSEVMAKTFTARVFSWMFVGLGVTAIISYLFASVPNLRDALFTSTGASPLFYIALFAPNRQYASSNPLHPLLLFVGGQ